MNKQSNYHPSASQPSDHLATCDTNSHSSVICPLYRITFWAPLPCSLPSWAFAPYPNATKNETFVRESLDVSGDEVSNLSECREGSE